MREQLQLYNEKCFIRGWYLNSNICDALIEYFERSNHKFAGSTSTGINKKIKDSTDCTLGQSEIRNEYIRELTFVAKEYMKIYPYVNEYSEWGIIERINIQKYEPKQGYFGWHTERARPVAPESSRHMVFMTYLNDVSDGGETEFYHQKIKVKPEKGLTLIWPADWTHTHRGITSFTEPKYIITGWFNFL